MDEQVLGWRKPKPLNTRGKLPSFPLEGFPEWLRAEIVATAEAKQVPVDLPAMVALAVLSVGTARRVGVSAKPGWVEATNVYVAAAMGPGEGKSPVFNEMTEPVTTVESELVAEVTPLVKDAEARRKVLEQRVQSAGNTAARADDDSLEEALRAVSEAQRAVDAVNVPVVPRLTADDATPEQLATLIAQHGNRMAVLSAEGNVFQQMQGFYSKSGDANLNVYLKSHSGTDILQVDRRDRCEYVKYPALTIGVTVQPETLLSIGRNPELRGRGLTARFLWALPQSMVGYRNPSAPGVPASVRDLYQRKVCELIRSLWAFDDQVVVKLSPEALERHFTWAQRVETNLRPGGKLANAIEWGNKLAGQTLRIAGLLHAAHTFDQPGGIAQPLSVETFDAAVGIAEYLVDHALATFDLMGADTNVRIAEVILDLVKRSQPSSFSKRDVFINVARGLVPKAKDLDEPLQLLVDYGWLRKLDQPRPGRSGGQPPSPKFEPWPGLLEQPAPEQSLDEAA